MFSIKLTIQTRFGRNPNKNNTQSYRYRKKPKHNSDGLINWLRRARIGFAFHIAAQNIIVVDPRLPFATRTILSSHSKIYERRI